MKQKFRVNLFLLLLIGGLVSLLTSCSNRPKPIQVNPVGYYQCYFKNQKSKQSFEGKDQKRFQAISKARVSCGASGSPKQCVYDYCHYY